MTFQDWLNDCGKSKYRVAKDLGVAWTTLWRWVAKGGLPQPDMMRKIEGYTGGAVTPNDWISSKASS